MQEQQMELAVGVHDHQLLEYFLTCWSNAPSIAIKMWWVFKMLKAVHLLFLESNWITRSKSHVSCHPCFVTYQLCVICFSESQFPLSVPNTVVETKQDWTVSNSRPQIYVTNLHILTV